MWTSDDGKEHRYYKHFVHSSIDDAVKCATKLDADGNNVFFCVGTLKEPAIETPDHSTGKTKKSYRISSNIAYINALILDIDCNGEKSNEYANKREGADALKSFTSLVGLPRPTIIDSGGGLHVYWLFTQPVPADKWLQIASRFKALTAHFKFQVDNTRTSDCASILRVPGTHNYKLDTPRPVKVIYEADAIPAAQIATIIKNKCIELGLNVSVRDKINPNPLAALFKDTSRNTVDGKLVLHECAQLRFAAENSGEIDEPFWRQSLNIARFFHEPDYEQFNQNREHRKYNDWQWQVQNLDSYDPAPTTCIWFDAQRPGVCTKCKWWALRSTPARIGSSYIPPAPLKPEPSRIANVAPPKIHQDEPLASNYVDDQCDGEVLVEAKKVLITPAVNIHTYKFTMESEPPFIPDDESMFPFTRTPDGRVFCVEQINGVNAGSKILLEFDVFPYERIWDASTKSFTVKCIAKLPNESKPHEFTAMPHELVDVSAFGKLMARNGVLLSPKKMSELMSYMSKYTNFIQRMMASTKTYPQLGWQDGGDVFVMPESAYSATGAKFPCGVATGVKVAAAGIQKAGSFEVWREVIDHYSKPGWEAYAFGHLVGYAATLMRFTPYHGAIVSLIGTSGVGKTTIAKTQNSIFGHPEEPMLRPQDTYLSRMARLGAFNSLPVTYDEITEIPADQLSEFCYAITGGRGRRRLAQDGTMKEDNTQWCTILTSTSNASLLERLNTFKADASAESLRVFEYEVMSPGTLSKSEVYKEIDDKLANNYGHAIDIWLNYVVPNSKSVSELVRAKINEFDSYVGLSIRERYWSAVVGATLAAGEITNKLGLTKFNMSSVKEFAARTVRSLRGTVSENKRSSLSILQTFLNEHIPNTLTVTGVTSTYADNEPRNKIYVRIEKEFMYVERTVLRKWLSSISVDYATFKRDLMNDNIVIDTDAQKRLGAGTNFITPNAHCLLIDLKHPAFAQTPQLSIVANVKPLTISGDQKTGTNDDLEWLE